MGFAIPRYSLPKIDHAEITRKQLEPCLDNLKDFVGRYAPRFYRVEQASHAAMYIEGLLSDLSRKTCEPIAIDHGVHRKPLQHFVGAGLWDDEKVLEELQLHVREELGDPRGILILDPTSFLKKGKASVGVQHQYCGRIGEMANCQVGVFLAYAGRGGAALVDRRLYLPHLWCHPQRRKRGHVPQDVRFQIRQEIAVDLLKKVGPRLPHSFVVGDEEFGRPTWFRRELTKLGKRYVLEVPYNTAIRDLEAIPPKPCSRTGGFPPVTPFTRVATWAKKQPASKWTKLKVRDTQTGPLEFDAIRTTVWTKEDHRIGPTEVLLVLRSLAKDPDYWFYLSNAPLASLPELVRAASERQRIEECFERAKSEAGLAQYEVRSWAGWHHHMTLSMLATWFLTLEARRVGKKDSGSLPALDGDGLSHAVA
jgi:SRSO17 transposase